MNRGCGAGKVIYLIHFQQDWLDDVVAHKFEAPVTEQMENVFSSPRKEIVETDDIMFLGNYSLAQMGAEKTCSASYQNSHLFSYTVTGCSVLSSNAVIAKIKHVHPGLEEAVDCLTRGTYYRLVFIERRDEHHLPSC